MLCLINPTYEGQKSNQLITKRFLRKKKLKDIGPRIFNFELEVVENNYNKKSCFVDLCDSLLKGLGQNQQHHPAVHTGGVNRGRDLWLWLLVLETCDR